MADNSKLELGNTLFILQGENILIMDYDKNEINDEITIPYSRIHDYIISFSNILKHNGYIGV